MVKRISIDGNDTDLVTLDEAKAQCNVTGSAYDAILTSLISVARDYAEGRTGQRIIPATYEIKLDEFPNSEILCIDEYPVLSIESVEYIGSDGSLKEFTGYVSDTHGYITRLQSSSWPVAKNQIGAVTITFKAGYDGQDYKLPEKIKQAMLLMVTHWFNNREAVVISENRSIDAKEVPLTANTLLDMESVRFPV